MEKRPLTLLITIHSQFESVEFFDKLITDNNYDKKKVVFAFDCKLEEIPSKYINIIEKNNYKFFCPDENIGKLNLVIRSSEFIDSKFFKIIDQDDSIYFTNVPKLEKELDKLEGTELIRHKATKIKSKSKYFYQSLDEDVIRKQIKEGYNPHFVQGTNCDVIYPTNGINLMSKLKLSKQDFHNDILLSNFLVGMNVKQHKLNIKFYIQFHMRGQTKNVSIERSNCIPELYENYLKIDKEFSEFNFKKIMYGSKLLHKIYIKNFTKWYLKNEIGRENYSKANKILYTLSFRY